MWQNLAGVDDLGCGLVMIPNGAAGEVMQMDPATGLPVWGPGGAGGPPTLAQICALLATMPAGGAPAAATRLVGANCNTYTVAQLMAAGTTVATAFAAGVLTVTVNGVSANVNLRGQLVEDAFGVDLGYLLPI